MSQTAPLIRSATDADLPAIADIYGWNVRHGTGTFELDAPSVADMTARRQEVLSRSLPWLVAEREGQVLGYAYANYFRPRMAYRFALEDSIYLAPSAQGQGVGTLLLDELIRQCQALGARQMLAVIGDSANQGSIRLHAKAGFEETGVMRSVGWKFERWLDVVIMQKTLGEGDASVPVDPPRAR
jgi:phosphinothricin acetyltransferase